jgi:DNA-binding MarR family transcriptional regulator
MTNEIEDLLNEVRLLYHRIVQVGEEIHAAESATLGMRAVLEFLLKNGPTTVPDIARSRSVTRQHIQILVNALLEHDLVELEDNPLHKRSSLVALTKQGKRIIERMRKREAQLYETTDFGAKRSELKTAARTLEQVRDALKGIGESR